MKQKTKTPKKSAKKGSAAKVRSRKKSSSVVKTAAMSRALQIRSKWKIPQRMFARLMSCSVRSVAELEAGKKPSDSTGRRLSEIERLREALSRVVEPSVIPEWLDTPNDSFDGLKPIEVIERGEMDRIWRMVFYLESGVAS